MLGLSFWYNGKALWFYLYIMMRYGCACGGINMWYGHDLRGAMYFFL